MAEVSFSEVAARLAIPTHRSVGMKLRVASKPTPFVPPIFTVDDPASLTHCEVLLIRASAAVGKTTLARALSAERQIPILDLAKVPVATGSLVGILNDLQGGSIPPIQAFHNGVMPLLVDALDEGRLNSGDNGLLSFIETSADLILQSRSSTSIKLVMLGRPEAVAYADLFLTDKGLSVTTLDVGFFDEKSARELIHAYAQKEAKDDSIYLTHRKPADELITIYFTKIASALGFSHSELWAQLSGRSFAGYAPVLAAIGSLLPSIENFVDAQNRLNDAGTSSAWGVIESVLESIVLREKGKVCDQLLQAGVTAPIDALYSRDEQTSLLMQRVQQLPLSGTGRIRLSGKDNGKYSDQVQRFLPEHPFLKDGKFSNDVIASYVLADAIINSWSIKDSGMPRRLARQPFLWRSLKSAFSGESLLDGEYLGYVLSSFWNDPVTVDESVVINDVDAGGGSFVKITLKGESTEFTSTTPLHFYGQMRNVEIKTEEPLTLIGNGDGATQVFGLSGRNSIVGESIDLRATELRLRPGITWLDAHVTPISGQFKLVVEDGADYGWGVKLSSTYPFSAYDSTLTQDSIEADDPLVSLLSDCSTKSPAGTVITLFKDYSVAENDYLRSVYIRHGERFKTLIACLVHASYADVSPIAAAGASKIRVRLKAPFALLRDAARGSSDGELATLIANIRERL